MSKWIDADNAIERLGAYLMTDAQIEYGSLASEDIEDWKPIAIDILKGAPSIDIVPKRGEWINTAEPYMSDNIVCSVCGYNSICEYNFCPNCGADMRKESE